MKNDVTFLVPCINETASLKKTIEIILNECSIHIYEILIIICDKTIQPTKEIAQEYKKKYQFVRILDQKYPKLGGAYIEGIEISKSEYVLLMSSDLETNPHSCIEMINKIKSENLDVVLASRWIENSSFDKYGRFRVFMNYVFQIFFRIIYRTKITDLTHCFGVRKKKLLKEINWLSFDHSFMFEIVIRLIKKKYKHGEIATQMISRNEGKTNKNFLMYFNYIIIGIRVYFEK